MNFTNWIINFGYNPTANVLLTLWVFYLGFVLYAGCQNAIAQHRWLVIVPALPVIIPAGIIDVLFNQSIGRALFLESRYTLTFSMRLEFHYKETGWRGRNARWMADGINTILPHHIGG